MEKQKQVFESEKVSFFAKGRHILRVNRQTRDWLLSRMMPEVLIPSVEVSASSPEVQHAQVAHLL